jgi:hypothetical protein
VKIIPGLSLTFMLSTAASAQISAPGEASIEVVISPRTNGARVSITADQSDVVVDERRAGELYTGRVTLPASGTVNVLRPVPIDILTTTDDNRMLQLYVQVGLNDKKSIINLRVFVPDASKTNVTDVERLENRLSTSKDKETAVPVYFESREIFRYWSGANPEHNLAIRTAKVWFDAAFRLATSGRAPRYRMDQSATDVLQGYEDRAAKDRSFERELRAVISAGYLKGMKQQLEALDFQRVALVGELVRAGDLESARLINEDLLQTYTGMQPEQKAAVIKFQGVSEDALKANRAYIMTRFDLTSGTAVAK